MWPLDILQFLQKPRGGIPCHSEVGQSVLSMGVVRQTELSKEFGQAHKNEAFRLQTLGRASKLRPLSMKKVAGLLITRISNGIAHGTLKLEATTYVFFEEPMHLL